jgi:antitoxin VapB
LRRHWADEWQLVDINNTYQLVYTFGIYRAKEIDMSTATVDTAKIFTTGRSQAVRLPKAYRFNTSEVTIERQGDAVILRPIQQDNSAWAEELCAVLSQFKGMPELIERDSTPLVDDIESLDE